MTADHIDRAAEIIDAHVRGWPASGLGLPDTIARALDDAIRFVSPERDRKVAAQALRDAADKLNRDRRIHDASCGESPARTEEQAGRDHGVTIGLRQAVRHLEERAAAIERGEP